MAKLRQANFKEWKNNDMMEAPDYVSERNMLISAVNDIHDRFIGQSMTINDLYEFYFEDIGNTSIVFNGDGQIVEVVTPLGVITITYNVDGNPEKVREEMERPIETTFTYDNDGRITNIERNVAL